MHLYDEINDVVNVLSSRGAKVVLFPMPDIDAADDAPGSAAYPENDQSRVTAFNQIVSSLARHRTKVVTLVDLSKKLDRHRHFQGVIDGITVRWADGVHI